MKHKFEEGQDVKHFLYGKGTIKKIHRNFKGEICYDTYFPGLGKTITIMDGGAFLPADNDEDNEDKNVVRQLAEFFGIPSHELDKSFEKQVKKEKKDTMAMNERKLSLDNNGNVVGGTVFGGSTPEIVPAFGTVSTSRKSEPDSIARHRKIVMGLNELYAKKNADYGDSFHETFLEEGMAMARIRLSDKLNRFKSLTRGNSQQVNDESIRDTLLDLANYAIMTVIELDREGVKAK